MRIRMECTEEEEEDGGPNCYDYVAAEYHMQQRESVHIIIVYMYTYMDCMDMITYMNVLTFIHISHPTHIPVPDCSVEIKSIMKHCG